MKYTIVLAIMGAALFAYARPVDPTPMILQVAPVLDQIDPHVNATMRPILRVETIEFYAVAPVDAVIQVLEARGAGGVGKIVEVVKDGIVALVNKIKATIQKDKDRRDKYTQQFIEEFHKKYSHKNVIMCHPKHTAKWEGVRGKDWDKTHVKFRVKLGAPVGYDVYWGGPGVFTNHGDGGYLNWAFIGVVLKRERNVVTFGKPT